MSGGPIVLRASDPVSVAAYLMERYCAWSVQVEEDGKVVGTFTEVELLTLAGQDLEDLKLGEVVPREPRSPGAPPPPAAV